MPAVRFSSPTGEKRFGRATFSNPRPMFAGSLLRTAVRVQRVYRTGAAAPLRRGLRMTALFRSAAVAALLIFASASSAAPPEQRPMKVDDLFAFKRVANPQISPD